MIDDSSNDDDLDFPDEDERRTATRRLFAYSPRAIEEGGFVDRVLVNHPGFKASMAACDRLFQLGRELGMPQGAVIVGPPGVGKTALIRHFRKSLPSSSLFEPGVGAVAIRLPARPNVGQIVGAMLRHLSADGAFNLIYAVGVRLLPCTRVPASSSKMRPSPVEVSQIVDRGVQRLRNCVDLDRPCSKQFREMVYEQGLERLHVRGESAADRAIAGELLAWVRAVPRQGLSLTGRRPLGQLDLFQTWGRS